ncbi:MAG: MarR family transcriptional regulator [Propionibacteriaceae bacterium]
MQTSAPPVTDPEATTQDAAVESVLYALMSIGRLLRQRVQGDGMDPGTFWLLKGLATTDAMRVTDLAAMANLDASTVSRHVQQLHRTGLIERTPDPDDGRAHRVALSTEGRALLNKSLVHRRELLSQSLEGWDAQDIEAFDTLLNRFVRNIENNSEVEQA